MSLPQTAPKINHTEITSGPWRVVPFNIGYPRNTVAFDIRSEGGRPIGTIAKKADAHLASAAPDLLEALKSLDRMHRGVDWCDTGEQARRWANARAAIKRAEGREGE